MVISVNDNDDDRWEMTEKKRVEERREGEREREGRRIVRGSKVKYFCLTNNIFFTVQIVRSAARSGRLLSPGLAAAGGCTAPPLRPPLDRTSWPA